MNYILKTATDESDAIIWQALYHQGIKQVEASMLDIDKITDIFDVTEPLHHIRVAETNTSEITEAFPERESFSYLLDHTTLEVGMTVYFQDGEHIVTDVWEEYRPSGLYPVHTWVLLGDNLVPLEQETFYSGHQATMFRIANSEENFYWDDVYANNQSTFYDYLIAKKNI